jgi:hypothetical protein
MLPRIIKACGREIRDLSLRLGIGPKLVADNRRVLEGQVFPYCNAQPDLQRILFVGCHWYTWHYQQIFAKKEFWTLEIAPERARYGSKRHAIDSVENVEKHFDPGSLDVIMMIGVIGWGLDEPLAIESSLAACFRVLRAKGLLILGCDEVPEHQPVNLEDYQPYCG